MVEVVSTDDVDKWLRSSRTGSADSGSSNGSTGLLRASRATPNRLVTASGNYDSGSVLGTAYLQDGQRVILLLCGGDKATQQRDIERAHELAEDRNEEGQDHG